MKKVLIKIMIIFISLIIPNNIYAMSFVDANDKIDVSKNCSLTLNYNYDDYKFDNINVKIYYVASVTTDFRYQLSSLFSMYPIKINGIKTIEEWDSLKDTLNSYISADSIEETYLYSNQSNVIEISNLKPGLYFVKIDKINTDNYKLVFEDSLISIPSLDEDGDWDYDVSVYPKAEEYIPRYEEITYTVMKKWIDNKVNRPKNVDIEIYKDGVLVDSQVLSSDNNWMYKFEIYDDGSEWSVVERNVFDGYNVSILKEGNNFIIVNNDYSYVEDNPKTFDDIKLYLYLFVGSLIGVCLLIISLIRKKIRK